MLCSSLSKWSTWGSEGLGTDATLMLTVCDESDGEDEPNMDSKRSGGAVGNQRDETRVSEEDVTRGEYH